MRACDVVYWLTEQAHCEAFNRLVVVAEPRARRHMPKALLGKVHGKVAADLTHATPAQVQQQLAPLMAA